MFYKREVMILSYRKSNGHIVEVRFVQQLFHREPSPFYKKTILLTMSFIEIAGISNFMA